MLSPSENIVFTYSPCYFSPLSEIPGSIELLENSLTYEGVQWRKIIECTYTYLLQGSLVQREQPLSLKSWVYIYKYCAGLLWSILAKSHWEGRQKKKKNGVASPESVPIYLTRYWEKKKQKKNRIVWRQGTHERCQNRKLYYWLYMNKYVLSWCRTPLSPLNQMSVLLGVLAQRTHDIKWHRIYFDATWWCRIDVDRTSFWHQLPTGWCLCFLVQVD